MTAPWHQQAWKEEAVLRISGQVRFGETMLESNDWTRRVFGYQFRSTVASSRSLIDTILFWRPSRNTHKDDGIDGSTIPNQVSNRPHCVIANGLALQLVPNSLKVLQKLCAEYDVPLFVIRDPRSWGGNTHPDDLGEVLRDVQKTVKSRIVTRSLQHSAGTAFARGRYVGHLERDAAWQAKDAARRTQEASSRLVDAFRKQQGIDWSTLDEEELEKRLEFHGLVRVNDNHDEADPNGESSAKKELVEALSKIAIRYGVTKMTTDQNPQSKGGD